MSPSVFLNDRPYSDGQEDPQESLRDTLSFSVDDWGSSRAMAWTWGIVNGWDPDAMAELAEKFRWDAATTARLDRLHTAFAALPTGDTALRDAAQPFLEAALNVFPEDWISPGSSYAIAITVRGSEVDALREALRSTPAAPKEDDRE